MPRAPVDVLPQTRLIYELKRWIDRARHSETASSQWEIAVGHLSQLLLENPTSALSKHVLHNLGCTRRAWVRQLSTKLPRSEATDLMWRVGCGR